MSKFKFDFNLAAQEAYRQYPKLQANAVFVEQSKNVVILPPRSNWRFQYVQKRAVKYTAALDSGYGANILDYSPYGIPVFKALVIDENKLRANLAAERFKLFSSNHEKDVMGTIDHEIGHMVVKGAGDKNISRLDAETRADLYSRLRYIQRFGKDDDDMADTGFMRLNNFLNDPDHPEYLTTLAVDKLVIDSKTADFIKLNPKQIARLAEHYAEKYLPTLKDINQLKKDFALQENSKGIHDIVDIALAAPVNSLSFYMGARAVNGYMQIFNDKIFTGKKAEKWFAIRKQLEVRMKQSVHGDTLRYFIENSKDLVNKSYLPPQADSTPAPFSPTAVRQSP